MGTVFDLITRRQERFYNITGFEIKYHQLAGKGIVFNAVVYSRRVAELLLKAINEEIEDQVNFIRGFEETVEINDKNLSYSLHKWRIEIPYTALSGDVIIRLEKKEELFRELSITSHTIRDHFFSFMNSATNLTSCIKESEKLLESNLVEQKQKVLTNEQ